MRDRETQFEEILGYHLEQAYGYLTELGPLDAVSKELAVRAANKLGSAGRRAIRPRRYPGRRRICCSARRPSSTRTRPSGSSSQIQLGGELLLDGKFAESLTTIEEAAGAAARIGNERLERRAAIAHHTHTLYGSEEAAQSAVIQADVKQAIEWFESEGDLVGKTSALQLLAELQGTAGRYEEAAAAFLRVIAAAQETGDQVRPNLGRIRLRHLVAVRPHAGRDGDPGVRSPGKRHGRRSASRGRDARSPWPPLGDGR